MNIIQAIFNGKLASCMYSEDLLTSVVFGLLKYLPKTYAVIPFVESAFLYDEQRTQLWKVLSNKGIDMRCSVCHLLAIG